MKKIIIFTANQAGVVDDDSIHMVKINGKKPIKEIPFTEKNLKKYFKDAEIPNDNTEIKNT